MRKLLMAGIIIPALISGTVYGVDKKEEVSTASQAKKTVEKEKAQKQAKKVFPKKGNAKGKSIKKPSKYHQRLFNRLAPKDKERLRKLYEKNPSAYYSELMKLTKKFRQHESNLNKRVKNLVKKYRQSTKKEEKEKLLKQIRDITRRQFYVRLHQTDRRLKETEAKLAQLRKLYHTRKKNAKVIIENRVKALTCDPNMRW